MIYMVEVWVMMVQEEEEEEDGKQSFSWSKKDSFQMSLPNILTCWNHDRILLRTYTGTVIQCHFLANKFYEIMDWRFPISCKDEVSAVVFQQTLVSLRHKVGGAESEVGYHHHLHFLSPPFLWEFSSSCQSLY
ncbi:OLC1v1027048C1 [Oldenlandia corymbosa var. corymbosa]|uniref:OLC1v1027048C1 n=1 Tax=Oldenlandia corymbosa var. corymbosa TaxID=529605 RepID=A0AAV1C938_OLDCO|nr:OLC1v1027048C1 [Oldenlandia corymbosa var. corymbosa]